MIIGACMAARQEIIRFKRINGDGSKFLLNRLIELKTIQIYFI